MIGAHGSIRAHVQKCHERAYLAAACHANLSRSMTRRMMSLALACALGGCAGEPPTTSVCEGPTPAEVSWVADLAGTFDVMLVGELHGNRESAERFLELTCGVVGQDSRPTVVGVEVPDFSVDAARAYFRTSDTSHLEEDVFWSGAKDGRGSLSNLSLLGKLFELERKGEVRVYGFDDRVTGTEDFPAMVADSLDRMSSGEEELRDTQWVLLLGGGHVATGSNRHSVSDELVARNIRTAVTVLVPAGGESWVCRWGECGVSTIPSGACDPALRTEVHHLEEGLALAKWCIGDVTPSRPAAMGVTYGQ